jgi:hypothetical protein
VSLRCPTILRAGRPQCVMPVIQRDLEERTRGKLATKQELLPDDQAAFLPLPKMSFEARRLTEGTANTDPTVPPIFPSHCRRGPFALRGFGGPVPEQPFPNVIGDSDQPGVSMRSRYCTAIDASTDGLRASTDLLDLPTSTPRLQLGDDRFPAVRSVRESRFLLGNTVPGVNNTDNAGRRMP